MSVNPALLGIQKFTLLKVFGNWKLPKFQSEISRERPGGFFRNFYGDN